jgi:hypothetical protein
MKKIYLLICSALLTSTSFSQTLLNSDFENGSRTVTASYGTGSITSEVPNNWYCADSVLAGLVPTLSLLGMTGLTPESQCSIETNAASGASAVGLRSAYVNDTMQLPGILANAKMSVNMLSLAGGGDLSDAIEFNGGTPLGKKALASMTCKVFSDTSNREDASISVLLYGSNPLTNTPYGIIGRGYAVISPDTAYQDVNLDIQYNDPNFTMTDTMIVMLYSSVESEIIADNPRNFVIFDDIQATYEEGKNDVDVSVKEINELKSITLYPNPAKNVIFYSNEAYHVANQYSYQLLNIEGRIIQKEELKNKGEINISTLQSGIYMIQILENGKMIFSDKIMKN